MTEPISTSALVTHGLLAIFWAFVHALNAQRNGQSKTFVDFISLVIMSSFSWVMFGIMWLYLFPASIYLSLAMSGTWAFLWVEWMGLIVKYFKTKFK